MTTQDTGSLHLTRPSVELDVRERPGSNRERRRRRFVLGEAAHRSAVGPPASAVGVSHVEKLRLGTFGPSRGPLARGRIGPVADWYPVDEHPDAPARMRAFYSDDDGNVYSAADALLSPAPRPVFRVIGGFAYQTNDKGGIDLEPLFEIRGSFAYPAKDHPAWPSQRPWYQLRG